MALEQLQNPTHLTTLSQKSVPSPTKWSAEKKRRATDIAEKILRCFPDYGKWGPHYVIGLVELIEQYPDHIQDAFADLRNGIPARCKFLPTIADFVVMAGEIMSAEDAKAKELSRIADLAARVEARRRMPEPPQGKQPVRYHDKHGNWINEREAMESIEQAKRDKESMARAQRMTDYVRWLGGGDGKRGWDIVIERGITEVPADWAPAECVA